MQSHRNCCEWLSSELYSTQHAQLYEADLGKRATRKCIQNMEIDLGIQIDKGFLYVLRRAKASQTKETAYTETQSPKKAANRPGSWELC